MDGVLEGFIHTVLTRIRHVLREYARTEQYQLTETLLELEDKHPKTFFELYLSLVALGDAMKGLPVRSVFIFLIDEIEALPNNLVAYILRFFRGLFGHYAEKRSDSPYRVITLTTSNLCCRKLGASSPYNISRVITLKPFSLMELDGMLDSSHAGESLKKMNIEIAESAKGRIMMESGGHPYFIQRLCHVLVKRCHPDKDEKISLNSKDVLKAVLRIIERGDKNLKNLYQEISLESDEWQLCKSIVAGFREPFAANDPTISHLVELGIVSDVKHYCRISTGFHRRQILKRYFTQKYREAIKPLAETDRLLLNTSCLQGILLNGYIDKLMFGEWKNLTQEGKKTEDEIATVLSDYLDKIILKDRQSDLDMEEIHTYIDYYKMEPVENQEQVLTILLRAFICHFREI